MGLGKTIQVAGLLSLLHASDILKRPVLIVAPLTVLSQWVAELHKWCPDIRAVILHSSGTSTASKASLLNSVRNTASVVIMTYAGLTAHVEALNEVGFDYIILDEGHKICNPSASVTIAAKTFATPHRIILSGSPIQNTLKELWCLFDFVVPSLLGNLHTFVEHFEDPIKASRNPKASRLQMITAVECAKALRAHIAPYLLRRLKKDVNTMLPAKHERVIRCTLTDSQLELYTSLLCTPEVQAVMGRAQRIRASVGYIDRHGRAEDGALLSNARGYLTEGLSHQAFKILSQLRLITNHVDLHQLKVDDIAEGGTGKQLSFRSNREVNLAGSGKLAALKKMLRQWKDKGHKVLIFSQFRMMLDIIENLVEQEEYKYIRMDGTTQSRHRSVLIDTFNEDESVFVALMTTRVGGLGVNLTGADRVVIFDPDWNPVTDEQARERAWRIGQRREVCVYRMITAGTVEEHILHRQLAKTYVTEKVLKDPTLQRFFSIATFTEAFLLGSEYSHRVPENIRHTIVATSLNIGTEVDVEMERENNDAEITTSVKDEVKQEEGSEDRGQDHETSMLASLLDGKGISVDDAGSTMAQTLAEVSARRTLRKAIASDAGLKSKR